MEVFPWLIQTLSSKTEADRAGVAYCLGMAMGIDHHLPIDIPVPENDLNYTFSIMIGSLGSKE